MEINKKEPLLVTGRDIRPHIRKLLSRGISSIRILSREDIDPEIELLEEKNLLKDIKYVQPDISNYDELQKIFRRIIWEIKDIFSADEYLFVLFPFDYASLFRNMTERLPWIKVLSMEGVRHAPEIKDRITYRTNMFLNIFSLILKEDIDKAEKETAVNMSSSPWRHIIEGIIAKHKSDYNRFNEKIMEGLRENPYLLNIFPLRELKITEYDKDLKEKNLFFNFYDKKFRRLLPELSDGDDDKICFKHLLPAQLEVQMNKKTGDKINKGELKKYVYDLKIEFMAKKGLILPDIVFTEHISLHDYSILLKGFTLKKNEPFVSIQKLINDIKEIIYKKSHFFIDINQTDDILGRARVKCPARVEKLDSLRIPVDSMWKIFQYLLKKGGTLLNIEPVLEITGELWQNNRDTALIAEKTLEKLMYIDEKNMPLGKLYFIWQNRLKEKVSRDDLDSHVDYSVLAEIIKDFDFSSFLSKRGDYIDTVFFELKFFNKKAWLIALDFADINEFVEAFKEAPPELYEYVLSLLPSDTVSLFRDATSQPLIEKSITQDGRVNLFNIFRSLVILGKCHFPGELLSSSAWLSLDRLHVTYERKKLINSLTDREKIAIILHNLPEPLSVFLQILFPDYKPPEYHHEISWEIVEEFYEKYFKKSSKISDSSISVKSFDMVILKAGEKICREDYEGAIDILKEEPENRIADFLISVLLKYTGKSACSDEYLSGTTSHILLQYGWQDKKMSPLELGYYLSHTDFYRKYGENYLAACGYRLKGEKNPNSLVFYEQAECYFDAEMYSHAFISYGKSLEWLKRENRYKPSDFMKNLLSKLFHTLYLSQPFEEIASAVYSLPEEKIFPCLKLFSSEENLKKILTFKEKAAKEKIKEASVIKEILCLCTEDFGSTQ